MLNHGKLPMPQRLAAHRLPLELDDFSPQTQVFVPRSAGRNVSGD
jgi:hypothetical protein